jgi:hypothetical protein
MSDLSDIYIDRAVRCIKRHAWTIECYALQPELESQETLKMLVDLEHKIEEVAELLKERFETNPN